jgi:hypothetical protein
LLFFRFQPVDGEVVQVLNVGNNHWICATNIGRVVRLYGMGKGAVLDGRLKKDLCDLFLIMGDPAGVLRVECVPIQPQNNAVDCGLYAIANCVTLGSGIQPSLLTYDQKAMREHLYLCLEIGVISMFPHTVRKRIYGKPEVHFITL